MLDFIYVDFNFILLNFSLFFIGIFGLFATRKNLIIIFMAIELILLSGINNFSFSAIYLDDLLGFVLSLYILGIAACESAIGLALLVSNYRHKAIISIDVFSVLKG